MSMRLAGLAGVAVWWVRGAKADMSGVSVPNIRSEAEEMAESSTRDAGDGGHALGSGEPGTPSTGTGPVSGPVPNHGVFMSGCAEPTTSSMKPSAKLPVQAVAASSGSSSGG
jgi:hypothetical protein